MRDAMPSLTEPIDDRRRVETPVPDVLSSFENARQQQHEEMPDLMSAFKRAANPDAGREQGSGSVGLDRTQPPDHPAPEGPERLLHATIAAFRKLRGLNAITVLDMRRGEMVAAKSGSPLCVGLAESGYLLASDHAALVDHTRRVCFVRDGQAVLLKRTGARFYDMASSQEVTPEITQVEWQPSAVDRGPNLQQIKRLHEVLQGAAFDGGYSRRQVAKRGHHDDRRRADAATKRR